MKAQQLKNAILQLAIQGKLVPQDPNDEPASILLEKIQQEKQKLIEDGKIKKSKKSSDKAPYTTQQEKPFEIPESWVWVRLGDFINLISGQDLTPDKYSSENIGIPYITGASNFNSGSLIINRYTINPSKIVNKGDLLITCKGTIGEMAFLDKEKAHIARQVMAIQSNTNLNKKYLYYYLVLCITELKSKAKSMIPGIAREDILRKYIPLPPLNEQKQIVEKIENLFSLLKFL